MSGEKRQFVLKRMAGLEVSDADRAVPETPARTLRLALARAAIQSIKLPLSVSTVADDILPFDDVFPRFPEDHLHLGLLEHGELAGYAVFDHSFRIALVEAQMMGRVAPEFDAERPVTSADAVLCGQLVTAFFSDLCADDRPGEFESWVEDLTPGKRIRGPRDASLALRNGVYRLLEFGVELTGTDRTAQLSLVLPDRATMDAGVKPATEMRWGTDFKSAVLKAPAELTAVLHRTRRTLKEVAALEPGNVIPLHGVTVDSIVLEAVGRKQAASGRLGQVNGMRAIRLTDGEGKAATLRDAAVGVAGSGSALPTPGGPEEMHMPEMPQVAEGLPDLPDMPEIPDIPDFPDLPDMPGGDGLPGLGADDGLPELPDLPDLPDLDGGIGDGLPDLPELPPLT